MQQPETSDHQYLWVLDPIDGTKSFITGEPSDLRPAFVPQSIRLSMLGRLIARTGCVQRPWAAFSQLCLSHAQV